MLEKINNRLQFEWRKISASQRSLPDFIIAGTQKGGTTSLFDYLIQHPNVLPPIEKEIHYFDSKINAGKNWYKAHFPFVKNENFITGEASPSYLYFEPCHEAIHKLVPNAKIILVLRNPVDRAFSHFHMMQKRFKVENRSFSEAIRSSAVSNIDVNAGSSQQIISKKDQHFSYVERGFYLQQIKSLLRFFPKNQLKVYSSESLFADPQKVVNDVFDFLSLAPYDSVDFVPSNTGSYVSKMSQEDRSYLEEIFQEPNENLFSFLEKTFPW